MRTQAEIAAQYKVNVRTVRRWVERGVDIQNEADIAEYLSNRKITPPRPGNVSPPPRPPVDAVASPPDESFDFTTTDRLISNLSDMAGRAARDLEAARASGSGAA